MTKLIPWFTRTFELSLPVEMHAVVVERLRGLSARVREKVDALPAAALVRRDGEQWSIQEHVGHLADLETLWHTRLDDFDRRAAVLSAADLENRRTYARKHNDRPTSDVLGELVELRGRTLARVDAMSPEDCARVARHPRLDQPMRVIDFLLFVAEHDDHHLARMTELARSAERH